MDVDGDVSTADSVATPVLRYRQRLEKSTGGEVQLMEWSPTMDLLAVVLADHSVSQYCPVGLVGTRGGSRKEQGRGSVK